MSSRTLNPATTAEAYLQLLKDRGIDVFLGNAGTDFASLVEAFARFEADGRGAPRPPLVPHEFVAVCGGVQRSTAPAARAHRIRRGVDAPRLLRGRRAAGGRDGPRQRGDGQR